MLKILNPSSKKLFHAGALIELSGDVETAFEIYYDHYDIHEPPKQTAGSGQIVTQP